MKLADAIKGYILDCKVEPQSEKHIKEKARVLKAKFLAWCERNDVVSLDEVTTIVLKGFMVYLQEAAYGDADARISKRGQRLSPTTQKDYMTMIRAFFSWCEREGYLEGKANPVRMLPRVKLPKRVIAAFSAEQMQAMLDECAVATVAGFRDYAMLILFMDTGIRVSECCNLRLLGVYEDYIRLIGKNDKEREVGISPATARAIFRYIHQYRPKAASGVDNVFLTRNGKPLRPSSLWRTLRRIGKAAGVDGVRISPHTLRHSFSKLWMQNGGDVFKLSRVLGHSQIQVTLNYLKDFKDHEARADHQKFSPVSVQKLGRKQGRSRKKPEV